MSNYKPLTAEEIKDLQGILDRWSIDGGGPARMAAIKRSLPRALRQIQDLTEAALSHREAGVKLMEQVEEQQKEIKRLRAREEEVLQYATCGKGELMEAWGLVSDDASEELEREGWLRLAELFGDLAQTFEGLLKTQERD